MTINPKYQSISPLLQELITPVSFEERGEVLYDIRNKVKRFHVDGVEVVVKRYGHITAFNRLMYSTFRKSKAKRAYRNASRLKKLGIDTPEGVAVLETFKHGILQNSFFISLYIPDRSLSFLRDFDAGNQALYPLLDALVAWLVKVHDQGVYHQDLNVGNILYRELPSSGFSFQLIDNNRMKFYSELSLKMRLKNLRRISDNVDLLNYILKRYAELLHLDTNKVQLQGCFYLLAFEAKQYAKRKLKHCLLKPIPQ